MRISLTSLTFVCYDILTHTIVSNIGGDFMDSMVFTRQEAADAMKVSLPTLDAYLKRERNSLPSITTGRRVLIPVKSFERWLEEEAARCMGNEAC